MALPLSTALVSPIGLSPGALFSALVHTQPQRLILVAGPATIRSSDAVLNAYLAARKSKPVVEPVVVEDPLGGFVEARERALALAEQLRESGTDVVVNLTGGTTVLQYCVLCAGLAMPGSRFVAVTDDRGRDAQVAVPFVLGKLVDVPRPITRS